jgi:hypothetical protein
MVNLPGAFSFIMGPRRQKGHLPSIRATIKLTHYSGHAILGVRRRRHLSPPRSLRAGPLSVTVLSRASVYAKTLPKSR